MIVKGRVEGARKCNPTDCMLTVDFGTHSATFTFCPLHEAAPELYDAIEPLIAALAEYGETQSEVIMQARAALLKANPATENKTDGE